MTDAASLLFGIANQHRKTSRYWTVSCRKQPISKSNTKLMCNSFLVECNIIGIQRTKREFVKLPAIATPKGEMVSNAKEVFQMRSCATNSTNLDATNIACASCAKAWRKSCSCR